MEVKGKGDKGPRVFRPATTPAMFIPPHTHLYPSVHLSSTCSYTPSFPSTCLCSFIPSLVLIHAPLNSLVPPPLASCSFIPLTLICTPTLTLYFVAASTHCCHTCCHCCCHPYCTCHHCCCRLCCHCCHCNHCCCCGCGHCSHCCCCWALVLYLPPWGGEGGR